MKRLIQQYRRINLEKSKIREVFRGFNENVVKIARPIDIQGDIEDISKREFMYILKELNDTRHLRKIERVRGEVKLEDGKEHKIENEYFVSSSYKKWWGKNKRAFYVTTPKSALMCLKLNLIVEEKIAIPDKRIKNLLNEILNSYQVWEMASLSQQNELFNERVIRYKYLYKGVPKEKRDDKFGKEIKKQSLIKKFSEK